MPELPEVETVCRELNHQLKNKTLKTVNIKQNTLRYSIPLKLQTIFIEKKVLSVNRRGKYGLIKFFGKFTLLFHLGMSGRVKIFKNFDNSYEKHDHLEFIFNDGIRLVYNDPRRFGLVDILETKKVSQHFLLSKLGPEPLEETFTVKFLEKKLISSNLDIKTFIMNQKIIAGIGNIYACEALFMAKISPKRKAVNVVGIRAERLVGSIKKVLKDAIKAGGSSLKDYRQVSGELGYFQNKFLVYGRHNQHCVKCNNFINRIQQNKRSTYFCGFCQR
tara:strand:- start:472 stop:1296 length:825 start_codon:yes stop_codon:yes gene_type:complete